MIDEGEEMNGSLSNHALLTLVQDTPGKTVMPFAK